MKIRKKGDKQVLMIWDISEDQFPFKRFQKLNWCIQINGKTWKESLVGNVVHW